MSKDKTHLNAFIRNIFEDNYAKAKEELQSAVLEKMKDRMAVEIQTQTTTKKA
jgi:hypothetical protein